MRHDELIQRLKTHEDNFVERKPDGVNDREIRKTIVAFANSVPEGREAILFIGIENDGTISGCANPDKKQKSIRKVCEQDCYPPILFESEVLATDDGEVVAVVIRTSDNRPHFAGAAYVRRGSESVAASAEVFSELIYARSSKVAAILKLKNQVVSVVSIGHKLGDTRRISGSSYRESAECRVLD